MYLGICAPSKSMLNRQGSVYRLLARLVILRALLPIAAIDARKSISTRPVRTEPDRLDAKACTMLMTLRRPDTFPRRHLDRPGMHCQLSYRSVTPVGLDNARFDVSP